jgi:hypothetical protein
MYLYAAMNKICLIHEFLFKMANFIQTNFISLFMNIFKERVYLPVCFFFRLNSLKNKNQTVDSPKNKKIDC